MKKLVLLSLLALSLVGIMNAQTQKGKFLIGASSNMSFLSGNQKYQYRSGNAIITEETDYSSFNLSITAGYFVVDNLVIGINPSIYQNDNNNYTSKSFKIGPLARYYFGTTNVKPYLGVQFGLSSAKNYHFDNTTWHGSYAGISGGVAFFILRNLALEGELSYIGSSETNTDDSDEQFSYRDLSVSFGFALHF